MQIKTALTLKTHNCFFFQDCSNYQQLLVRLLQSQPSSVFVLLFFSVSTSSSSIVPQVCRMCNSTKGAACNSVNATCNVNQKYCYAFWTNDSNGVVVSHAGCWEQSNQCDTSSCAGRRVDKKNSPAFFCCCNASLCNLELSVGNTKSPVVIKTPTPDPGESRASFQKKQFEI